MLQLVARLGRHGSLALPSPTLGISASTINPAMILDEYNTLNPETFRFGIRLPPLGHVKTRVGRPRRFWARLGASGTRLGGSRRILRRSETRWGRLGRSWRAPHARARLAGDRRVGPLCRAPPCGPCNIEASAYIYSNRDKRASAAGLATGARRRGFGVASIHSARSYDISNASGHRGPPPPIGNLGASGPKP